jgi:hypothetical protein
MSVWSMEYASMAHHSQIVIKFLNPQNSRNNWSSDEDCASWTFQLAGAHNLTSPLWNLQIAGSEKSIYMHACMHACTYAKHT